MLAGDVFVLQAATAAIVSVFFRFFTPLASTEKLELNEPLTTI